jgi:argininosuccinate synthase
MVTRVVVACCGDLNSFETITRESQRGGTEVVAVAIDLGTGELLTGLKEAALAAGAVRCHSLDLREEFARDVILPAAREVAAGANADQVLSRLGNEFVSKSVCSIASIEEGQPVFAGLPSIPRNIRARLPAHGPAVIAVRFEDGLPTAVNGIRMTLTELIESIETISGHRALEVLSLAYGERDIAGGDEVTFAVEDGGCAILPAAAVRS